MGRILVTGCAGHRGEALVRVRRAGERSLLAGAVGAEGDQWSAGG